MAHNSNDFLDADKDPHIIPLTPRSELKYLKSYHDLGVSKEVLQALLDDLKFRNPCRLHSVILPLITSKPYQSLCAQARPGFEKHTCYVLGILDRIDLNRHNITQAIVLCPTLQLAKEIHGTVLRIGNYMAVTSQVVDEVLPETPVLISNIVIGLPSTIFSLIYSKKLILSDVKLVVIDGADHLLNLGEQFHTRCVMKNVNADSQVLLFYSTLTDMLRDNIPTILPNWKWNRVFVNQEEVSVYHSTMYQHQFVNEEEKAQGIKDVLIRVKEMQAVVYVNQGADFGILRKALKHVKNLVIAPELAGGQADAIIKFKRAEAKVLITCNPIYFGFDISKVNLVFFFHLPVDSEGVIDFQKYYRVATWGGRYFNNACVFNMLSEDKHCSDEKKSQQSMMKNIESHFGRVAKCVGDGRHFRYLAALREGFIDYANVPLRVEDRYEIDDEKNDDEEENDYMLSE